MSLLSVETPDVHYPTCVIDRDSDGTFTPRCTLCAYVGRKRAVRGLATAALRQHRGGGEHRRAARHASLKPNQPTGDES